MRDAARQPPAGLCAPRLRGQRRHHGRRRLVPPAPELSGRLAHHARLEHRPLAHRARLGHRPPERRGPAEHPAAIPASR